MIMLKASEGSVRIGQDGFPKGSLRYRVIGAEVSIILGENTVVVPFVSWNQFREDGGEPFSSIDQVRGWMDENLFSK